MGISQACRGGAQRDSRPPWHGRSVRGDTLMKGTTSQRPGASVGVARLRVCRGHPSTESSLYKGRGWGAWLYREGGSPIGLECRRPWRESSQQEVSKSSQHLSEAATVLDLYFKQPVKGFKHNSVGF